MNVEDECWLFLNQVAAIVEARGLKSVRLDCMTLTMFTASAKWRVTKPKPEWYFNLENVYAMLNRDVRDPKEAADWIIDDNDRVKSARWRAARWKLHAEE